FLFKEVQGVWAAGMYGIWAVGGVWDSPADAAPARGPYILKVRFQSFFIFLFSLLCEDPYGQERMHFCHGISVDCLTALFAVCLSWFISCAFPWGFACGALG